ncbi:NAD(P)/FAD-dependent oxidoreductase [Marinobacterium sp. YM272]|uniref:NAD(P)/FAD-dependent oxidoreductase n=1 Tax=Marinobacterium sp. YM272 TaxID=3421654 RepID=UPI003D7F4C37
MNIKQIAIIGSGIAGMRLGELLTGAGIAVTVFEKSRGTGGRLASTRLAEGSADLGTAMIEPGCAEFEAWLKAQGAREWSPAGADFNLEAGSAPQGWVGFPRSSSLTRTLAESVELTTDTRVGVVWPDRDGVLLRDSEGEPLGYYDAVVVATPAPQAAPLLDAVQRFRVRADEVEVHPVWSLLISLPDRPARLAAVDWLQGEHPLLQRVVRDSSKPGRDGENWVIQASQEWSRAHRDESPDQVADKLLGALSEVCGEPLHPSFLRAHRWAYARAAVGLGKELSLWDEHLCIGACGDWLCGGDVEGAWRSANDLAARILACDSKVA